MVFFFCEANLELSNAARETMGGNRGTLQSLPKPGMTAPHHTALETSSSVAALRETLRIAQAEHAAEQREAARRMSQQAQRYAMTAEGFESEKVQIEADIRVRRMLNALRVKEEALSAATRRNDELEELKAHAVEDAARLRARCAELEATVRESSDHATHMESISRATKTECSRLKGQLANANFDLDLATQKYERLLATHTTRDLANDLVGVHIREAARAASSGERASAHELSMFAELEEAGEHHRHRQQRPSTAEGFDADRTPLNAASPASTARPTPAESPRAEAVVPRDEATPRTESDASD